MLGLLLAAALAPAQMPPSPGLRFEPVQIERELHELCFPSGLRVTMRVDKRQPAVSIVTVIGAGANLDAVGQEGTTHLAEHLWFRARPKPGADVTTRLQALGASWNAQTMPEAVVFQTEGPAPSLRALLELEAGRLRDPLAGITDEVVNQERAITQSELRRTEGLYLYDLPSLLPDDFVPATIGGRARPDTETSIAGIDRAALAARVAEWTPARTIVRVSGDLDPAKVQSLVLELFPDSALLPAPGKPPDTACAPVRPGGLTTPPQRNPKAPLTAVHAPVKDPTLLIGWALPAGYGADEALARLGTDLLTTRLFDAIVGTSSVRRERFEPGCSLVPGTRASAWICSLRIPDGTSPSRLLAMAREGIGQVGMWKDWETSYLTDLRLRAVTDLTLSVSELSAVGSNAVLADALAHHVRGTPMWFMEASAALESASPDQVRAWMDRWLPIHLLSARVLVPPGTPLEAVLGASGAPDMSGSDRAAQEETREAEAPAAHHVRLDAIVRNLTPASVAAPRVGEIATATLKNGVRVVAVRDGELPIVRVAVQSDVGPDDDDVPGASLWYARSFMLSTEGLPVSSYRRTTSLVGGAWRYRNTPHGPAFTISGTVGNLDDYLWLLRHTVQGAKLYPDPGDRDATRLGAAELVKDRATEPGWRMATFILGHVLGATHPLALSDAQLLATTRLTEAQLKAGVARTWSPPHLTVAVTGGIDPAEAIALVRTAFETLPVRKETAEAPPARPAPQPVGGTRTERFVDPERTTARVTIACPVQADVAPEVAAVGKEVLQRTVWSVLRTSTIAAYDPEANVATQPGAAAAWAAATVAPAQADAAGRALSDALAAIGTAGPEPRIVQAAAEGLAQQEVLAWLDGDWVRDLAAVHREALPKVASERPARLLAVTPEQVAAWLAPCGGAWALGIVGPP